MARVSWLALALAALPLHPAVAFQQRTTPRPNPRLEQYQREDGTIEVPAVLRPYVGDRSTFGTPAKD